MPMLTRWLDWRRRKNFSISCPQNRIKSHDLQFRYSQMVCQSPGVEIG